MAFLYKRVSSGALIHCTELEAILVSHRCSEPKSSLINHLTVHDYNVIITNLYIVHTDIYRLLNLCPAGDQLISVNGLGPLFGICPIV